MEAKVWFTSNMLSENKTKDKSWTRLNLPLYLNIVWFLF